ncbi:MAG: hypothetical protein BGO98_20995 [Myxococcales bacterium 68-20]|nr:MAG: hypothetical protein BGO98_20995 [Myxococcales bacterium 68-20]
MLIAGPCVAFSIVVACASPADVTLGQFADAGGTPSVVPTEEEASADPPRDAGSPPVRSSCSDAGWCATELPEDDLDVRDILPFEGRAFAIAESQTLGVKTLEWDPSNGWRYIDDNTQNAYGSGAYAGTLWGPNENEIYYGVAPGFIYHGTRKDPSSPWSWERSRLEDHGQGSPELDHGHFEHQKWANTNSAKAAAVGVWGRSEDDVYAWYANTIFRRQVDDGGQASWVVEHVVEDATTPSEALYVLSASGSGPGDMWFSGARARYINGRAYVCPIVLHKTADGYTRVVDHVVKPATQPAGTCTIKPGHNHLIYKVFIAGMTFTGPVNISGYIPRIESSGPNAAVGMHDGHLIYMRDDDEWSGVANPVSFTPVHSINDVPAYLSSIWINGEDAWLSAWGAVLKTDTNHERWKNGDPIGTDYQMKTNQVDGGLYEVSTIALNGAALDVPFHQVRGTSNTNIWAVGQRYALHKTTP